MKRIFLFSYILAFSIQVIAGETNSSSQRTPIALPERFNPANDMERQQFMETRAGCLRNNSAYRKRAIWSDQRDTNLNCYAVALEAMGAIKIPDGEPGGNTKNATDSGTIQTPPMSTTAINRGQSKGTWPKDMEPGNLYFVTCVGCKIPPYMVSARTEQDAIRRVGVASELQQAEIATRTRQPQERPINFIIQHACTGPAWGAITRYEGKTRDGKPSSTWGGGCGKTPELAIRSAFSACDKAGNSIKCQFTQDHIVGDVYLALSGNSSTGSYLNMKSFGAFNAYTESAFGNTGGILNADDAVSKLGKSCGVGIGDGWPCYLTSTSARCFDLSHPHLRHECLDRDLTSQGYAGLIRVNKEIISER